MVHGGGIVTPDPGDTTSTYPSIRIFSSSEFSDQIVVQSETNTTDYFVQKNSTSMNEFLMSSSQVRTFYNSGDAFLIFRSVNNSTTYRVYRESCAPKSSAFEIIVNL